MLIAKKALKSALLFILIMIAALLCASLYVIAVTVPHIYSLSSVPNEEVALVLGASVYPDGTLSTVLRERADEAIALYRAHTVKKILVSGDNSSLNHDEVYPVGRYLTSKGIPQQDIFLDYAGFDTYSSMYRAKDVFGVSSMIICTQRFHLPRAIFLARSLGIEAVGVDAGAKQDNYFNNYLREIPAMVKALFDLAIRRVPKYLGQQYFVTGNGDSTWIGPKAQTIYFKNIPS